jgi:hypothetical protein
MRTEEDRSAVQSDPRKTANSNPARIRASLWIIVLIVVALALAADLIWIKG